MFNYHSLSNFIFALGAKSADSRLNSSADIYLISSLSVPGYFWRQMEPIN